MVCLKAMARPAGFKNKKNSTKQVIDIFFSSQFPGYEEPWKKSQPSGRDIPPTPSLLKVKDRQ
jgi:hypothetical protein